MLRYGKAFSHPYTLKTTQFTSTIGYLEKYGQTYTFILFHVWPVHENVNLLEPCNNKFDHLTNLIKRFNFVGYLKYQMSTFINPKTLVTTTTWKANIYRSLAIGTYPVDEVDCMNQCLNVDFGSCFLFVYENGVCYLGRPELTTGSVTATFSSVTIYNVISNYGHCF